MDDFEAIEKEFNRMDIRIKQLENEIDNEALTTEDAIEEAKDKYVEKLKWDGFRVGFTVAMILCGAVCSFLFVKEKKKLIEAFKADPGDFIEG